MGKHRLPVKRQKPWLLLAALAAPIASFFAIGASAYPLTGAQVAEPAAEDTGSCCMQLVAMPGMLAERAGVAPDPVAASRLRIVPPELPTGVAPERGLQVETILAARSISDAFPEILQIGGVRSDALRWHPNGLALDVMVPNPGSAEGIALGDEIVSFALQNAQRFGLQDVIWRGVYYTPDGGRQRGGYGHYDHVHVTTTGGGYPTGREIYFR